MIGADDGSANMLCRPSGVGLRVAGRLAVALVGLLLVACSSNDFRDEDGRVIEPGEASVFELEVGDCLDPGDVTGELSQVLVVPCDQPHTQELYASVAHPGDGYPGAAEVAGYADGACLNELEGSLGYTLDDGLYFSYLLPTFDGWTSGGDRQIMCVLVFPDREAVTGSFVAGTANLDRIEPVPPQEDVDEGDDEQLPEGPGGEFDQDGSEDGQFADADAADTNSEVG